MSDNSVQAQKGFPESAMIALLPTTSDWCKIKLPHMTLVYAGEIPNLMPVEQNEMAKTALDLALACHKMTLVVMGVDVFGDADEKVEVLRLRHDPQLTAMRAVVEHWNASEHPFNPHCTVGPIGSTAEGIPDNLTFDRIAVGWGDDLLQYKLLN